ncbi:protein kinase subdomain-containing protein [Penicillium daleae]|uniref:Protein kinase subdomain-containing protein n=1 Tax=Penicillium daleae TaxID=63821 RepID=A0AAD6BVU7_9EURO|nr:protein kinase subdomain-containing protein [Penicillium daleae]KAJ5437884.1 protein kinase subdomain-containing protein [Penicillium daleae]
MEKQTILKHDGKQDPVDTTGLCLLSLDGGGVRGLSSLYIFRHVKPDRRTRSTMHLPSVASKRKPLLITLAAKTPRCSVLSP